MTSLIILNILITLIIALYDFSFYRIPNIFVIFSLFLGILFITLQGNLSLMVLSFSVGIIVFLVGWILFTFRMMGGGDVKLLAVSSMWCSSYLLEFYLTTILSGGALALFILKFKEQDYAMGHYLGVRLLKIQEKVLAYVPMLSKNLSSNLPIRPPLLGKKTVVPYGVAITFGLIVVLVKNYLFGGS